MSRKRSGSPRPDQSPVFHEDSLQSLAGTWWTRAEAHEVTRGQLLWAHVPYVDHEPLTLHPVSRTSPTEHRKALFRLEVLRTGQMSAASHLPVAALPTREGEVWTVQRGKLRPVLVFATGGTEVEGSLRRGAARWQSLRTLLVAPYFGAESSTARGGWKPEFVRRIRHCQYPQYFWESLPVGGAESSILRLDQIQPLGCHHNAYEYTPHRLSGEALAVLDEWLEWYLLGRLEDDGALRIARAELPGFADTTDPPPD